MKDFKRMHPIPAAVYFAAVIVISMFTMHPVFIILSLAGSVLGCAVLGGRKAFSGWPFYVIVFLLTALINPLVVHRGQTVLFYIGLRAVTAEALIYGFAAAGVLVSVLMWFKCMGLVLTDDKIMYLFGRTLPKTALVISAATRLVPLFVRQIRVSADTQKCMGAGTGKGMRGRISMAARVFSANISRSLEDAVETAASMRARGYGAAKRSSYAPFKAGASDILSGAVIALLLAAVIYGLISGAAEFSYYPSPALVAADPHSLTIYICYGLLLLLPVLTSAAGRIKWKYCMSAI